MHPVFSFLKGCLNLQYQLSMKIPGRDRAFIEGFVKCAFDHKMDEATATVLLAHALTALDQHKPVTKSAAGAFSNIAKGVGQVFGGTGQALKGVGQGLGSAGKFVANHPKSFGALGAGALGTYATRSWLQDPNSMRMDPAAFGPSGIEGPGTGAYIAPPSTGGQIQGGYSAPGDYAMNALYGESPPQVANPAAAGATAATPGGSIFSQRQTAHQARLKGIDERMAELTRQQNMIGSSMDNPIERARNLDTLRDQSLNLTLEKDQATNEFNRLREELQRQEAHYDQARSSALGKLDRRNSWAQQRSQEIADRMTLERNSRGLPKLWNTALNRAWYGASPAQEDEVLQYSHGVENMRNRLQGQPDNPYY